MEPRSRAAPGEVGKTLLGEVLEEDFTKFLSSLRSTAASQSVTAVAAAAEAAVAAAPLNPHYPVLNIPSLDNLLHILFTHHHKRNTSQHFQAPHEQSTASSSTYTTTLPIPPTTNQPIPPPVAFPLPFIELASTTPCAGKTHLLYYICTVSVLPYTYDIPSSSASYSPSHSPQLSSFPQNATTITLNGENSMIVILDTDNRFDISRLRLIMKYYILTHLHQSLPSSQDPPWLTSLIQSSLTHIHIFRPITSTSHLHQTLLFLPKYLYSLPPKQQNRKLAGVLVDSISAFYWEDRCGQESGIHTNFPRDPENLHEITTTTSNATKKQKSQMQLLEEIYTPVITHLRKIQSLFGCFIVATRRMYLVPSAPRPRQYFPHLPHQPARAHSYLPPPNKHPEQLTVQSPLPNTWINAVTLRIVLQRSSHPHPDPHPPPTPTFTGKIDTIHPLWGGGTGSGTGSGTGDSGGGRDSIDSTTATATAAGEITYWIGRDGMGIM